MAIRWRLPPLAHGRAKSYVAAEDSNRRSVWVLVISTVNAPNVIGFSRVHQNTKDTQFDRSVVHFTSLTMVPIHHIDTFDPMSVLAMSEGQAICIPPHMRSDIFPRESDIPATREGRVRDVTPPPVREERIPPTTYLSPCPLAMEKNYPCEKGALPTPITSKSTRKPWRRLRLIACLALFAVALHTLFTFPTRSLISTSTVATAVPPLDNEWWLRCGGLIPVPEGTYTGRLDKIEQALDGAVWVAEPGESVSYFLGGFGPDSWSSSERPFLIAIGKEVIILTPAFEEARAKLINLPDETKKRVRWVSWAESESPYATLLAALGDVEITLDGDVRSFIAEGIRRTRRHVNARGDIGAAVATIRERKDEREVGLMRCANEATLHAIRKTRERMYLGIHESQTRTILYEEMKQVGLNDYSALILFGPNAALPHGSGTDRTLAKDEMVLIDAGGRWGGYISDITRVSA